jgi:N5-(cytidine 5'-diphosphoramidyl)-L-glutamine hydrolase
MKKILVTQRMEYLPDYGEKRDSIDQKWTEFLISIDLLPVFISNNQIHLEAIIKNEEIHGAILTGGGNLVKYGGEFPERDQIETNILEWAIKNDKAILGVCRGMQLIQDYFDIPIERISNHVGIRHQLQANKGLKLTNLIEDFSDVNSFHNYGTTQSANPLNISAFSNDGIVMALEHSENNIYGIMWHPEREKSFMLEDKKLFRRVFR